MINDNTRYGVYVLLWELYELLASQKILYVIGNQKQIRDRIPHLIPEIERMMSNIELIIKELKENE